MVGCSRVICPPTCLTYLKSVDEFEILKREGMFWCKTKGNEDSFTHRGGNQQIRRSAEESVESSESRRNMKKIEVTVA